MVPAFHPLDVERGNVSKPEDTWNHLEAGLNQRLQKSRDNKFGTHFQPLEVPGPCRRRKFLVEPTVLRKQSPPRLACLGRGHGRDLASGFVAEELDCVECGGFRLGHSADFLARDWSFCAECTRAAKRNRSGSVRPGYPRIEYQGKRASIIVVKSNRRVCYPIDGLTKFVTRQAA